MHKYISLISIYRKKNKLTQKELAELAGVSRRTINYIEAGKDTRLSTALALSNLFGVPINKLWIPLQDPGNLDT